MAAKLSLIDEAIAMSRSYQCPMYKVPMELRKEIFEAARNDAVPKAGLVKAIARRGYRVGDTVITHIRNGDGCNGCACLVDHGPAS